MGAWYWLFTILGEFVVKPGKIINFQKWKNDNNNNKLPEWFREA